MTKNQNKVKADVARVKLGYLEFEGLMLNDGTYGIAVPQVCSLFQLAKDHGTRDIKAILGKDFQLAKWCSTLHPKAVNVLLLPDFERLIFRLALKQNQLAVDISEQLIGLSLQQLFSDAFNIQFEEEQRQAYLKNRQEGKYARRTATDALKDWLDKYGHLLSENERKFVYIHISEAVNKVVFDRSSVRLRTDWKLNNSAQVRDFMIPKELKLIEQLEDTFMRVLDQHGASLKPLQALHLASQGLYIPVQVR
jgi:hypothetical protein